ncbi:MAG: hypothetical protein COV29_03605 [Candidatus Yanofskybacteria bacterium CG10_big_fil_rev_8_21_14_0_10_36_16]|uniref:dolichyl-phosphate beta-glucosyltransferase n=1 Tax=Candidatus Yanofskybacteria bacterium CG10_big_fil_rev_8_21_14_0_10_36_16 TaxID=1975096 RepID=A0A2J0Q765_9BACT|nr:MAG: hypothetical protein COV29_03605 [Candidatus Yanofskybacteria bacterium CG10_big_fil_rev_8_21_14_0_10_36_16]
MKLSIIIPAYNEENRIEKTLKSVDNYLSIQDYDYEILVVNDGSKDNTADVVSGLSEQIRGLRLIDNKDNHGKGWVVKQGMLEAKGDIRLFMDADNSTTVNHIGQFWKYFSGRGGSAFGGYEGYDVVIGSRRIEGSDIAAKQPWLRDFLGGVFRLIVHTLVPLGVNDSQAGFKAFTAEATKIVFSKQTIFRWAFDVEILAIAKKSKLKIKEAPIKWINDEESKVRLKGMIQMLLEVLQVRINLWFGKYK